MNMRILVCFFMLVFLAQAANSQYSAEMDHANSSLYFEDKPEMHLHDFTLECWIMIRDTGLSVITGEDNIPVIPLISRGFVDSTLQSGLNFFLGLRKEDYTMVADFEDFQNHVNHKLTGYSTLLFNHWYHLAATYDGVNLRLYLNGKPEALEEINESPFSDFPGITGIGKMFDKQGNSHGSFSGLTDAIRIWNYARSDGEILQSINAELINTLPGLLVSLNLNEGQGTMLHMDAGSFTGIIEGNSFNWAAGAVFQTLIPPETNRKPLLQIGIISDPQYCHCSPSNTRFYPQSLGKLKSAIDTINTYKPDFVITLGDVTDRYDQDLDSILPLYHSLQSPYYFLLGNHEFESIEDSAKKYIVSKLGMPSYYYSFIQNNWRFLVLDGTELLTYTIPMHPELKEEGDSVRLSVAGDSNAAIWNGGISKKQQAWIRQQLTEAYILKQEVIVFCHFPVYPAGHSKNLWNSEDIIDILESFPNVVAYIAGHYHLGNYGFKKGKHYLTHKGIVETESVNSFSVFSVYPGKLIQNGYGLNQDRILSWHQEFKTMMKPQLLQYSFQYNSRIKDLIGRIVAQDQMKDVYRYAFLDNSQFDSDFFLLKGDSLTLQKLPEKGNKTEFHVKIGLIDADFDTSSVVYSIAFDTISFVKMKSFNDMILSPDSAAVLNLAGIYNDRSRFGLTYNITVKDESIVSGSISGNNIVIEPRSTGNTEIIIRTIDDYTGYSLLDSFKISIQDTANISSIEDGGIGKNSKVLFYPNPSRDIIFINLSEEVENALECSIMDCTGNTVKVIPLNSFSGNNIYPVETGFLTPGYYFLRIYLNSGSFHTLHFIKL
jgi:manganese-dependent ADP-ribose/CDP-alcohol diphosphatase